MISTQHIGRQQCHMAKSRLGTPPRAKIQKAYIEYYYAIVNIKVASLMEQMSHPELFEHLFSVVSCDY